MSKELLLANRTKIRNLVSSISPLDERESKDIAFAKEWIDSGVEIFRLKKPDVPNIHLVAYTVVMDPVKKAFLLAEHRKAEMWLPPGGHVDVGEHPQECAKRELMEELGIEATFFQDAPLFLTVSETQGSVAKHTDVSLWYLLAAEFGSTFKYDAREFKEVRWFTREQMPYSSCEPHMKRFCQKITELTY